MACLEVLFCVTVPKRMHSNVRQKQPFRRLSESPYLAACDRLTETAFFEEPKKPSILNPKLSILNLKPETINPKPPNLEEKQKSKSLFKADEDAEASLFSDSVPAIGFRVLG